jgi:hypothetical protein
VAKRKLLIASIKVSYQQFFFENCLEDPAYSGSKMKSIIIEPVDNFLELSVLEREIACG